MAVAYSDNIPVGISLYTVSSYFNLNIFVKPKFRRLGIGTKLYWSIEEYIPKVRYSKFNNLQFFKSIESNMSKQVVEMSVRGTQRRVHLEKAVRGQNGKSRAKIYINSDEVDSGRTSVTGTYSIKNGRRRFTTNSLNADLL